MCRDTARGYAFKGESGEVEVLEAFCRERVLPAELYGGNRAGSRIGGIHGMLLRRVRE